MEKVQWNLIIKKQNVHVQSFNEISSTHPWQVTMKNTSKQSVIFCDWSLGREQKKSWEETEEC